MRKSNLTDQFQFTFAIAVVGLYALYDIYRAWNVSYGKIDSAGHLGGVAFGLLCYFAKIKPRARKFTKLWTVGGFFCFAEIEGLSRVFG
ncbi:Rhomboid protein 1, mitochondrial [Gigaspora margarita]|uniref:Rhomboid protein 1, mitochondrial n=1 Tax=Gigaspora margarita TaxID=4874 RepID=A0A8H3WZG1_GIGMA|nr:Rhomboid protein 1, mitochondrial [Gigaspora margarita]